MNSVAVIMSTYNGARFFAPQVESILEQEGVAVDLYIRDDGSTDPEFLDILQDLEGDDRVHISRQANVGVGNSFMQCLYSVPDTYDYYALADQDDVWFKDKLARAIDRIEKLEGRVLYASNQMVVDQALRDPHKRFDRRPGTRCGDIIRGNVISGCTFVMSNALFRFLTDAENRPSEALLRVRIHDAWIAVVAALFGQIVYDDDAYLYYRQHGGNVVGAESSSPAYILRRKLKYLTQAQSGAAAMCNELIRVFGGRLGVCEGAVKAMGAYRRGVLSRFAMLSHAGFYRHENESSLVYALKAVMGKL